MDDLTQMGVTTHSSAFHERFTESDTYVYDTVHRVGIRSTGHIGSEQEGAANRFLLDTWLI